MVDPFSLVAGWLQEHLILPLLYATGGMAWEEISFNWALFAVYGLVQMVVTFALCMPLERFRPVETWPDSKAVWVDVIYTFISRVGVLPLVTFVLFYEIQVNVTGFLSDRGWVAPTLERLFPVLMGHHILTFFLYAAILDYGEYWRHRLSHTIGWWYGLHSVHHAQRQMTFWSDDRNHVLDDIIGFIWFMLIALLIGIPPLQFPLLVLLLRLVESLSHANARLSFGWLGDRLLVSPRFHRIHHGILAAGTHSCNYGAILPWWDILHRTADFGRAYAGTGDPGAPETMATGTWLQQQRAGLHRMVRLSRWGRRRARLRATAPS